MSFRDLSLFKKRNVPVKRDNDHPYSFFNRDMESLFNDFFRGFDLDPFYGPDLTTFNPRVDVREGEKEFEISAELPGIDEKDINVTLNNDSLTITGEKREEREDKEKAYHRMERTYGSFCRTIPLPHEIETKKVEAVYKKGILTVKIPKSPKAIEAKKKITVKVE